MQIPRLKTDRLLLKPLGTRKSCTTDRLKKLNIRQTADATGYSCSQVCSIQTLYRQTERVTTNEVL
jgi:hypothetical protein